MRIMDILLISRRTEYEHFDSIPNKCDLATALDKNLRNITRLLVQDIQ